jgi:tRNA A37 threonylcarbamoyladenosine synthetase subunit TsaC/SUA5/YrdC
MSSNNKKLSSRQYLLQHAEDFKLADFYVYFNYAARQEAEYMLKGAITLLSKKRKNISKAVKNLLDMVQNDEYAVGFVVEEHCICKVH